MELMRGEGEGEGEGEGGSCRGMVPVVIGDGGSTLSLVVARFLGVFRVPQVERLATYISIISPAVCLSNKAEFPAFLRTLPSVFFQSLSNPYLISTLAGLVAIERGEKVNPCLIPSGCSGAACPAFCWTWVQKLGACVALHEIIPKNHAEGAMTSIVAHIQSSGAGVDLMFALEQDAGASTASVLSTPPRFLPILQGSMGFAICRAVHIPGLQEFLMRLHPSSPDASENPFLHPFWEEVFGCSLQGDGGGGSQRSKPLCSGSQELGSVRSIYSDVSQLRISYNVYKAVYAIAHALQAMRSCETERGLCPDTDII
ncbi:unnamed protein product, partial [Coregonus sp. 'balchen']